MARRRFYRANLPTVVWDKDKNKALVEFVKGEFTTGSGRVANILIEKGYPEVGLDDTDPPDFQVKKGRNVDKDVRIMPSKYDEGAALNKQLAQAALKRSALGSVKPKREVKRRRGR